MTAAVRNYLRGVAYAPDGRGPDPVRLDLTWRADRPLEVDMLVSWVRGHTPWLFAWQLLRDGYHHPAGDGDVHIRPSTCDGCHEIQLSSPDGECCIHVDSGDLAVFIEAVHDAQPLAAPPGAWVDEVLAQLFPTPDRRTAPPPPAG